MHILNGIYSKDKQNYKEILNFKKFVVGSDIDVGNLKLFGLYGSFDKEFY